MNDRRVTLVVFRGHELPHILDSVTKKAALDQIFFSSGRSIGDPLYRPFGHSDDSCFAEYPVVLTVLTSGQRAWLYFTKLDGRRSALLIPKRINPGYPFPRVIDVSQLLSVPEEFYDNTLCECEIVGGQSVAQSSECPPITLFLSDIIVQRNLNMQTVTPLVRFSNLRTIFAEASVRAPNTLGVCVKTLYTCTQLKKIARLAASCEGYDISGLAMFFCSSDSSNMPPARAWLDKKNELSRLGSALLANSAARRRAAQKGPPLRGKQIIPTTRGTAGNNNNNYSVSYATAVSAKKDTA